MLKQLEENSRRFSQYASNVTSQCGEDGIIAKALSLLPARTGWCVEFGAWDGKKFSNTWDLITSHQYRAVLIEANPDRFRELEATHGASGRNVLVNAFVGFEKSDNLDALLSRSEIPQDYDLLSIDIDGNDYHVWAAAEIYRPSLVIIEYNPTMPNSLEFVQKREPRVKHGSSPASLVDLAKKKGYELIACTEINLLFVRSEYYPLYGITDNSLRLMRDESGLPRIFIGYDGHVFLSEGGVPGSIRMPWHGLDLTESEVQKLPGYLQSYLDEYSPTERILFRFRFGFRRVRRLVSRILHPWRDSTKK